MTAEESPYPQGWGEDDDGDERRPRERAGRHRAGPPMPPSYWEHQEFWERRGNRDDGPSDDGPSDDGGWSGRHRADSPGPRRLSDPADDTKPEGAPAWSWWRAPARARERLWEHHSAPQSQEHPNPDDTPSGPSWSRALLWDEETVRLPSYAELRERRHGLILDDFDTATLGVPRPDAEEEQAPAEAPTLTKKVKRGAKWSLVNTLVIRIGNFSSGVVLAHGVLSPTQWGLYATGMVALNVLLAANEMGVSLAVVRWEGDIRRFAPTVLTLATASSVLLYIALYVSAPQTARLLGSPGATAMLRVLCLSVIIDGLASVPAAVMTREFAQRRRMVIDLVNFLISTGLTLLLAYRGWGAMSFAWGSLAGNVVALVGCGMAAPGFLRPGWNSTEARKLLKYGLPLAGASLLVLAMLNVDSAVVGGTLGATELGLYQIAFNISSWPVRSISEAARRVSFAGFSRLAHSREDLANGYSRALTVLMTSAVPPCVLLATLAEPIVRTVYGGEWTPAAGVLRYLAFLGLLRVAYEMTYDCLVAVGRQRALILVQGLWFAALIPALIVGAHQRGIQGVGMGHIAVAGLLIAPAFMAALAPVGISPLRIARACAVPFLGGALMAAVALTVHHLTGDTVLGLFLAGGLAAIAYVPFALPLRRALRPAKVEPAKAEPAKAESE